MPPLESSMIALETLTGMDTRLSLEDIFNSMFEFLLVVYPVSSFVSYCLLQLLQTLL